MKNKRELGHLSAMITIFIWGTTFISTKILLNDFLPVEILLFRFIIGFIALVIVHPKSMKQTSAKQELIFACAGLCGITLYYLLENIALTYTTASNVGVIISIAPFFTALISHLFIKQSKKISMKFIIGFIIAMIGISVISFGNSKLVVKPVGDILAVAAAFVWAIYSILTKKISTFGYNTIQTTRRIFGYGILFMIPVMLISDYKMNLSRFANTSNLLNMIFLGIGASALCFVTWNFSVKHLGAVKTSIYIYVVPVITVISSAIVLKERITVSVVVGTLLTLSGLLLSQQKNKSGDTMNEQ